MDRSTGCCNETDMMLKMAPNTMPMNLFLTTTKLQPNKPWFLHVCSISLLKTLEKGDIARNEQFYLFPQCFLPVKRTFCHLSAAISFSLEESKICGLGKGLRIILTVHTDTQILTSYDFREHGNNYAINFMEF